MAVEKEDGFGLSLSLGMGMGMGCPEYLSTPLLSLNLLPSNFTHHQQIQSSAGRECEIDINEPASGIGCDGDHHVVMVSSPKSTVSSVSGKRSEGDEYDAAEKAAASSGDDDMTAAAAAARKKLRLSKEQAAVLEETFKEHNTLNPKQKLGLAKQLNLRPRQVEVWFQNRRARTKLKQTEVDYEYLRRCCENLTEENRRLQKEVNELRSLKLSPHMYMNMSPPTTLIMCPQCKRVGDSSSSSSAASSSAPGAASIPRQRQQLHAMPTPLNRGLQFFPLSNTNFTLDISR